MKTKLMISALLFCSSLSLAGEPTAAPAPTVAAKKKMIKPSSPPSTDSAQRADEAVLGTGLSGLGTSGASTAPSKAVRGKAAAPRN